MKTIASLLSVNRLFNYLFIFIFFTATTIPVNGSPVINTFNKENNNPTVLSGIEYASLTAHATEKGVFINWVTVSEQNNSHFEVERSSDMHVYSTVALVLDGFAATGTGKTYKFKEDAGEVKKGKIVYYRLKQIDTDGQAHYSMVMPVKLNAIVEVFPNPGSPNLTSTRRKINANYIATGQPIIIEYKILLSKHFTKIAGLFNDIRGTKGLSILDDHELFLA